MVSLSYYRNLFVSGFVGSLAFVAPHAHGAAYHYVDWQTADVAGGIATGVITLADDSHVTVTFTALNADGSAGNLFGAQVETGTDYWTPAAPYLSEEVENAPPAIDIVQLSGGQDQTYIVELSEPIKDPTMAIVSLGQPSLPTDYDFDAPFEIVSQGAGYWGGSTTALERVEGDILRGSEGHGTIRFLGTFDTFSWTVPTPESWHGFTFGIRTTERLEPTPESDAGVDAGANTSGRNEASDAVVTDTVVTDAVVTDAVVTYAVVTDTAAADAGLVPKPRVDAGVVTDAGVALDAAVSRADGGGLDVDLEDVVSDAAATLDAGSEGRTDASAPAPHPSDSGANADSVDETSTRVECSCRTVGRRASGNPTSSSPASSIPSALFAPLALLAVAWGRRRSSRSAAR